MIKFIQYPKCSTCIRAKKWLESHGVDFEDRHIVEKNPTLEAIANVENSLAQILISEAHKIEKSLSISQNINEILKVNESVEHIITKVTILEQTLISKMEIYFRGKP